MGTADTTRHLVQPAKHYVGTRLQRGRVLTDADFDERQSTELYDVRRTLLDVIGPKGTPDDGFRIFDPVRVDIGGVDRLDASIDIGTMYVGGVRFEIEDVEQLRWQSDFLQLRPEDLPPWPQLSGTQTRTDLLWLEGIEEVVTAREDRELRDAALGGKDTSTRVRTSRRVRALVDVGDVTCAEAFAALSEALFEECRYLVDPDTCELAAVEETLRLRVQEVPVDAAPMPCPPCEPDPQGPFLGADHRAIRVMVSADAQAYTWGFDNAAPLYRVEVDAGGTVTFLDLPSDPQHFPRAGQVVEILGWSRLLDNGEKVATQTGFVTRAATAYNPFTRQLELDEPIPPGTFVTSWPGHPHEDELPGPEGLTYYLRVWDRGPVGDTPPQPLLPIVSGALHPLGATGIGIRWSGNRGCPGDFWLIARRPASTPDVMPWVLTEEPVPAMGPRRRVAPLALVTWRLDGPDVVVDLVHDCRTRFAPLTCSRTGCTLTVGGKGGPAAGNYATLQEAIDATPPDGGVICVMPGTHDGRFFLRDRVGIEIVGCGPATRLVVGSADGNAEPLGFICDSRDIRIADLAVVPRGVAGIQVREHLPGQCADVVLERLTILTTPEPATGASPKAAIELYAGTRVSVRRCRLGMPRTEPSLHPVALLSGQDVAFEDNLVECAGSPNDGRRAWGGVQIGGDALGVRVEGNEIRGGFGHGVTLGSVVYEDAQPNPVTHHVPIGCAAMSFASGADPRLSLEVLRAFGTAPGSPQPQVGSTLSGIVVRRNHIVDQGGSGISVAAFWPVVGGETPEVILGATNLRIEDNRIELCFLEAPLPLEVPTALLAAGGGICLGDADGVWIVGNVIRECAVRRGGCGVFAVIASEAVIERNVIEDVGGELDDGVGAKGGIVLQAAMASMQLPLVAPVPGGLLPMRAAARIVGNRVQQPNGRALQIHAIGGAILVTANELGSRGEDDPGPSIVPTSLQVQAGRVNARSGVTVDLFNAGLAYDHTDDPALPPLPDPFDDGRILFSDNHVTLSWESRIARGPFLASVVLQCLDEAAVVGNQLVAKLDSPPVTAGPAAWPSQTLNPAFAMGNLLLTQLYAVGVTVKIDDNRFTEGVTDALISALGVGVVPFSAMARFNHATHCVIAGYEGTAVTDPDRVLNHELINPAAPSDPMSSFCDATRVCIEPLPGAPAGTFAFQLELDCTGS